MSANIEQSFHFMQERFRSDLLSASLTEHDGMTQAVTFRHRFSLEHMQDMSVIPQDVLGRSWRMQSSWLVSQLPTRDYILLTAHAGNSCISVVTDWARSIDQKPVQASKTFLTFMFGVCYRRP